MFVYLYFSFVLFLKKPLSFYPGYRQCNSEEPVILLSELLISIPKFFTPLNFFYGKEFYLFRKNTSMFTYNTLYPGH